MLLVSDVAIRRAMRLLFVHAGLVVEPAGAAGVAALLEHPALRGGRVATVLCGGNVTPTQAADTGAEAAFGTTQKLWFFLYPVKTDERVTAPGTHLAFSAASRAQVAAVHHAALSANAADLFTPRERPDISATYFGAMFTDLDGHRIEVKTDGA